MKTDICGGSGFIGYHGIPNLLEKNHEVSALSIPDVEIEPWFPSDIEFIIK